ncbi:MAG TPA: cupin domain-containing protein [Tepidiformaceae bacterium]|jgi:quercetin dioxygenase-like cupin family protein
MDEKKTGLLGRPLIMTELVAYQPDAVVSRTIIDKKASTVTMFAFDEGQGLSEHTSPFDALVQVLDGETEITVSGHEHHLAAGQMIIMPALEPHSVKALTRLKMLLVMVRA